MVETTNEMEQILSQIKMVLGTAPGDVLGAPYFGTNIKRYIFNMSYNQEEISEIVKTTILSNISYDSDKYNVGVTVEFGKDHYNKSDYAVINITINEMKCLGIVMNQ